MTLSVEDIIAGKPRFRTKLVNYGNDLQFTLHTFDADSYVEEMKRIRGDMELSDNEFAAVAMRAITGQHYQPTAEQAAEFRKRLDKGVVQSILCDWIALNNGAENLADAAKKS